MWFLLPNGRTVHKTFGLPVPMFHDSSSSIAAQSIEGIQLKNTDVFIWDEAPMAPKHALEIADKTLRNIMGNNLPFVGNSTFSYKGGKVKNTQNRR